MRRLFAGLIALLGLTAVVLVLPVYSDPAPAPRPVTTHTEVVRLGSMVAPASAAAVQKGTTQPLEGVAAEAPALRVARTGVDEFSLVGVTWGFDPAVTDVLVLVRAQDADGNWGSWTEVGSEPSDQDAGTDSGAELRGGTAPLWTGPSTGVEVELVTRSGAQPTDVQLDLIDPGVSEADGSLETPDIQDIADAAGSMPAVYSRAQWGADESLRTWAPQYAPTIKAATLHHTADSNSYTADQVPSLMRSIYRYHSVSLGWGDIGYNVIVDKFGRLWEGRSGGLASTVMGAHAGGFNTSTFGVSMLGNYDTAQTTQPMIESVAAIIAWKLNLYGVDPRGTTSLTSSGGGTAKYAAGTKVTVPTVFGHREVGKTACPGRYGYAQLSNIRTLAASMGGTFVSPIEEYYNGNAAARAALGSPVGLQGGTADGQGLYRHYTAGSIYWSATGGAHAVTGSIHTKWTAEGADRSPMRLPVSELTCGLTGGGCRQEFQGGSYFSSAATGARATSGAIAAAWAGSGRESGPLGYPSTDMGCGMVRDGCGQQFERGSIYWSPATGAHPTYGAIRDVWMANGWERGPLGYASSELTCGLAAGGCRQNFQGGVVTSSPTAGSAFTSGAIAAAWLASGGESGPLGYPTTAMGCGMVGDGCGQQFERGSVYWTATTGAHAVSGPIWDHWVSTGWERGPLGYASSPMTCSADARSCRQDFEGATVFWSDGGPVLTTSGAVREQWTREGAASGWLGLPKSPMVCDSSTACVQEFIGGTVTWAPSTGGRVTNGPIAAAWVAAGRETGPLGYPSSTMGCGMVGDGCGQQFQGGSVYWTPATGAHPVTGPIWTYWTSRGWERGSLGYAVADMICGTEAQGCRQDFRNETVTTNAVAGTQSTSGAIRALWLRQGAQAGPLGQPTAAMRCGLTRDGCLQTFQGGSVIWSAATGTVATSGPIAERWVAEGRESKWLGYPTTVLGCGMVRGGCGQQFQGGSVYWSPATGAFGTSGAIRAAWIAQGWERGSLGFPAATMTCDMPDGGCQQRFEGGTLVWSPVDNRVRTTP